MRNFTFKKYILGAIVMTFLVSVVKAETVECAYLTRSKLVPVNVTAIALAESLNVVTCGRDKDSNFRLKGKAMGLKAVVVKMNPARKKVYNEFKLKKLMRKKAVKISGSSIW